MGLICFFEMISNSQHISSKPQDDTVNQSFNNIPHLKLANYSSNVVDAANTIPINDKITIKNNTNSSEINVISNNGPSMVDAAKELYSLNYVNNNINKTQPYIELCVRNSPTKIGST